MKIRHGLRRLTTGSLAALLIAFSPGQIMFATAEGDPCPTYPGIQEPTGAAAVTYTFNEETCLWENDYYTWSPQTKEYTKKTAYDYVYVPANGSWHKVEPEPEPEEEQPAASTESTGPDSSNDTVQDHNLDVDLDSTTKASIDNTITGYALSGNANVSGNTWGGSAGTGDANSVANVINMLQSSSGFGSDVASFSADINGDVYGDLYLDPNLLAELLGTGNYAYDGNLDVDINEQVDGSIHNDIDLNAQSGDAKVSGNTNGGDALSGSANAVLNLVNMINSAISSGQSFIGMLNINGNLNGDILLPPEILNQIIASNAPASQTDTSNIENIDILANFENNQSITNDLNLGAASGDANVGGNTNAGTASTGDADTNLTILNLTGRDVVAANSLLVFVNVLGQWVGLILDAPAGTTAAALGTGVSQNTTNDTNINIDGTINSDITNDVDLNAQSGDANVSGNTNAGSAGSGDASASANIVNIMNSTFALSDWFGILFINVFGTWNGSFGVDTEAGGLAGGSGGQNSGSPSGPAVFSFVSTASGGLRATPANASAAAAVNDSDDSAVAAAATDHTNSSGSEDTFDVPVAAARRTTTRNYPLLVGSVIVSVAALGAERYFTFRNRNRALA